MRRFVSYDASGTIDSTADYERLPEGVESPFLLNEGEFALEVPDGQLKEIPLLDLHMDYSVNVKTKKLVKRKAVGESKVAE